MATLIIDIETIGEDWHTLDACTKDALTSWIDRKTSNLDEQEYLHTQVQSTLGLSPLTGRIVSIGIYDVARAQGAIYYQGTGTEVDEAVGDYIYKQRSENEMLQDFWDGAKNYDTFVTFNGRRFDVPFLMHRSAILGIRPSADLMSGRYLSQQTGVRHIDLQDQLTFYGAMQRRGSLHLFCRAYGIESPKSSEVRKKDVAELFAHKQFRDIAVYNQRDVTATAALYEKWQTYFSKYDSTIDF